MSDDANTDELAYVKRICPNLSKKEQVAEAARIVPYFRARPLMVDITKFKFQRADAMSDEPDRGTWIAAIERALKVAKGNGAKTHPRVAVIKKPAGCDPCSYPECGCAYSENDPRSADAMSDDIVERLRKAEVAGVLIPCDDLKEAADEIERLTAEAKSYRDAIEWMRARDDRNGSLPEAYREKIDEALGGMMP